MMYLCMELFTTVQYCGWNFKKFFFVHFHREVLPVSIASTVYEGCVSFVVLSCNRHAYFYFSLLVFIVRRTKHLPRPVTTLFRGGFLLGKLSRLSLT